jgi:hypothetical protein
MDQAHCNSNGLDREERGRNGVGERGPLHPNTSVQAVGIRADWAGQFPLGRHPTATHRVARVLSTAESVRVASDTMVTRSGVCSRRQLRSTSVCARRAGKLTRGVPSDGAGRSGRTEATVWIVPTCPRGTTAVGRAASTPCIAWAKKASQHADTSYNFRPPHTRRPLGGDKRRLESALPLQTQSSPYSAAAFPHPKSGFVTTGTAPRTGSEDRGVDRDGSCRAPAGVIKLLSEPAATPALRTTARTRRPDAQHASVTCVPCLLRSHSTAALLGTIHWCVGLYIG